MHRLLRIMSVMWEFGQAPSRSVSDRVSWHIPMDIFVWLMFNGFIPYQAVLSLTRHWNSVSGTTLHCLTVLIETYNSWLVIVSIDGLILYERCLDLAIPDWSSRNWLYMYIFESASRESVRQIGRRKDRKVVRLFKTSLFWGIKTSTIVWYIG